MIMLMTRGREGRQQTAAVEQQPQGVATLLFNPILTTLLSYILDIPLYELYMFGPSLWGYGFHEGKQHSLICAEFTGVPELHWIESPDECESLIMRKFNALLVTVHFAMYMLLMLCVAWSLCGCALFYCCCRRRPQPQPSRRLCYRCAFRRSYSSLLNMDARRLRSQESEVSLIRHNHHQQQQQHC
jgi:hypothetical protein